MTLRLTDDETDALRLRARCEGRPAGPHLWTRAERLDLDVEHFETDDARTPCATASDTTSGAW